MVEETSITLLHKLASRGVESKVVEAVKSGLVRGLTVGNVKGLLRFALDVVTVREVESLSIAGKRVVAVNIRVLAGQVGLVEVIRVLHVGATQSRLDNQGSIRADKHSDGTSTASRAGVTLGIEGNVAGDDNSVTAVPGRSLDPIDAVQQGISATVASVQGIDTLDVGVVTEELHEDRLDRLGLVKNCLSADLEATDGVCIDVVLLEEVRSNGQRKGVDIYAIRFAGYSYRVRW